MDALNVLLRAPASALPELERALLAAGIGVTHEERPGSAPLDAILVDASQAGRYDDALWRGARRDTDVPLLLLTAEDPDDDTVIRALSDGVADVLARPFQAAALGARVRSAVTLRRLRSEVRDLDLELRRARESARDVIRDPLTDLYSRAYFDRQLASDGARAARYGDELSCAVMEVEGVATVRAEQGALAADRALMRVADTIVSMVRACDTVARLEDDVFAVILPATAEPGARRAVERIRVAVAALSAAEEPAATGLSLRAGVASLDADRRTAADLVERAQRELRAEHQS